MRLFPRAAISMAFSAALVHATRYVAYYDQYHPDMPDRDITANITHVIVAFVPSNVLSKVPMESYNPFMSPAMLRDSFDPGTKFMIAVGGWGDNDFGAAASSDETRALFANNLNSLITSYGFDGVDIDWEYPAGNGQDYKQITNEQKTKEIQTFPLLLGAIRNTIGPSKLLSIAVPGKNVDMIAYTNATAPNIWEKVDFVNIMSYDFTNRRDNKTDHHTSVTQSLDCINYYVDNLRLPADKANLGLAMYAKYFKINSTIPCEDGQGCTTVLLETESGADTGQSGAVTFERANFATPGNLSLTPDGTCGPIAGFKCQTGFCCSAYNQCGNSAEYCTGCLGEAYGDGCKTTPITTLFQRAMSEGITNQTAGGQIYYDKENNMFWTWDTPDLIKRKFSEIVSAKKLGGVMFWSLGENSYGYESIIAIRDGLKNMATQVKH